MKDRYKELELEILVFEADDIITSSISTCPTETEPGMPSSFGGQ